MFEPRIKIMTNFLEFFLGKNIIGITLCPFGIYLKLEYITRVETINHEKIHWKQQLEMLVIFFYLWYLIEWGVRLFTNPKNAYRSISFEREAYANDDNLEYLKKRKPFSWFKHI
jgi:hypothetical protein